MFHTYITILRVLPSQYLEGSAVYMSLSSLLFHLKISRAVPRIYHYTSHSPISTHLKVSAVYTSLYSPLSHLTTSRACSLTVKAPSLVEQWLRHRERGDASSSLAVSKHDYSFCFTIQHAYTRNVDIRENKYSADINYLSLSCIAYSTLHIQLAFHFIHL